MSLITLLLLLGTVVAFFIFGFTLVQAFSKYGSGWTISKFVVAVISLLFGIGLVFTSMGLKEVGPGQEGAKTRFGEVLDGTLPAGLHWMTPMVESLTVYEGRIQSLPFSEVEAATLDLQPVKLSGQIRYHLNPGTADDMLRDVGGPGDYAEKVLTRPAETILKDVTPRYTAANIIGKRVEIGDLAQGELQKAVDPYGLTIDGVSVANVGLAQAFLEAVENKQIAAQNADRALNQAEEARRLAAGERDAAITRAEGEQQSRILIAEGEAQANDTINASLTDDLLKWAAIQKFNDKVKVMLVPSDQGFILDLGQVVEEEEQP